MRKKFHNFLMKNEGEINLWKMDKHWGENMNKSKTNGQHKGQPWHCGNIRLINQNCSVLGGGNEMFLLALSQWNSAQPKVQKLGSKTLGFNSIHQAMQANSMNFQTT